MVQKMKANYRERILETNNWIDSTDKYGLILTDDLDSLLGCAILKQIKNWNIESIMLFNPKKDLKMDYYGTIENVTNEQIGVDFAKCKGKCFDNHLTMFSYDDVPNPESINLNNLCGIHRGIYTQKYNLSTVLLLWSLYDLPKTDLSDELMMLLLAIDSSYYSYFHGFHQQNKHWLVDVLDLPEFYECQQRHTENEFENISKKYALKAKITSKGGILSTNLDIEGINELLAWYCDVQLELPTVKFYRKATFKDVDFRFNGSPRSISAITDEPFCYALVRKSEVKYSVLAF